MAKGGRWVAYLREIGILGERGWLRREMGGLGERGWLRREMSGYVKRDGWLT